MQLHLSVIKPADSLSCKVSQQRIADWEQSSENVSATFVEVQSCVRVFHLSSRILTCTKVGRQLMVRSVQTNALRIERELTDRHSLLAQVPDIISTAKTSPLSMGTRSLSCNRLSLECRNKESSKGLRVCGRDYKEGSSSSRVHRHSPRKIHGT
jgi:hypothetical protein